VSDFASATLGNSLVGIIFFGLAAALTFLMFNVWKFPFDHERQKSAAPPMAVLSHRLMGYLFILIQQFKDIQSGARNNGITSTMSALVQPVTPQEIYAIASYLSFQQ
jgi:hypothetical protein